ncbi:MAG: CaiB/BaiF CoA-transferase family protein [Lachnospiraceae bacterium]
MKPLEGILVLDFSQYLAGPSCALRLADLGARVIKIERPGTGDNCRKVILKNLTAGDDSMLFHTINRNKESFAANMKDEADLKMLKKLIAEADVMIENFRPGIMRKNGLDYEAVKKINPGIVYGTVTGYGEEGEWAKKPGQDLMIQSMSGMTWLNGNGENLPTPFALSVVDSYTGVHLAEGILASVFNSLRTGEGALVQVSLMESAIDMQFQGMTAYLNDGSKLPVRSKYYNAGPYIGAPYGIYPTKDGYLALADERLEVLSEVLRLPELLHYDRENDLFEKRDEIKCIIADRTIEKTTAVWLELLEAADYGCSDVYTWQSMMESEGFQELEILQSMILQNGKEFQTTRCPITVDGERYYCTKCGPLLGEDTEKIIKEFSLNEEDVTV